MKEVKYTLPKFLQRAAEMLLLAAFLSFPSIARAQDSTLSCWNDYIPPLINIDFPEYPEVLNANITIISRPWTSTAPNPVEGTHSVLVYDPDHDLYRDAFYFNVNHDGTIDGYKPTKNKDAKGTVLSYSTVIGTYYFAGDNFPFSADTEDYQFAAVTDHRQYWLDSLADDDPDPAYYRPMTITSNYTYTMWARWVAWLNWAEGPYTPGAHPVDPDNEPVVFTLGKGSPKSHPPKGCHRRGNGCPSCFGGAAGGASGSAHHLAVPSLDSFDAGVVISDIPISYNPPIGGEIAFGVTYDQRLSSPDIFNYSNLGPQWISSWTGYIGGGPPNAEGQAIYYASDGGQYEYDNYEQTVVQADQPVIIAQGDFQGNDGWTHATLHYRQSPERYERWLPDGSVEVYGRAVGMAPNRQFFLTSMTDPQGNVTKISYDAAAAANGQARLTSVTDPKGGKLLFNYSGSDSLKITKVTRSCDGLSAKFTYSNGQLTSITDPGGITSSYHYASGSNFIDKMTTPYGSTTFSSTDGDGFWEADMTNPLGQTERVEYQTHLDPSLYSASDGSTPSGSGLSINNGDLNYGNSFYWTRRAMADAAVAGAPIDSAAFYGLAQVSHWAESSEGTIPVPLSTKMPLEGRVWFNYPGQNRDYVETTAPGTATSPSATARLLDGGATQATFASYNGLGMITQSVDPVGRTTNYNYDTNGIDLLTVTQANGTGQDLLTTMIYNSQHLPLTVIDASGRATTLTYNSQGQVLTSTDAKSETTTLTYNSNGYLNTVTGPVTGSTTTYSYDNAGRVHSETDSEAYVMTINYDNLDRPISISYPDGTSEQAFYRNLDVWKTADRQGRATYNQYDPIRELVQTTDPQGRTTKYSWCTCGGLSTLTDASGNVTTWSLDLQGRTTGKVYANGSHLAYVYENTIGRLHSMTDVRGDGVVYAYNLDNTLGSTTYSTVSGVGTTPNVSFGYDAVYNRVSSMVDGTGTTSYSYNSITGSTTTGAGRLSTVSVPIAGSSVIVAYSYDELGRVTSRTVDGSSTVSTAFDSLGRVTSVSNPLGSFAYAYVNTTSRLNNVNYPSSTGLSTSYDYFDNNGDQRLKQIKNLNGTTVVSRFDYTYNAAGTIATWKQQADSNDPTQYTLTYDNADRLTNATQTIVATSATISSNGYGYDPAGNRLAETSLSGTTGGQFNNLNQLTGYSSTATSQTVAGQTTATASSVTVNAVPATVTSGTNFTASVPLLPGTNTLSVVAKPPIGAPTTKRYQIVTSGTPPTQLTYDADGNSVIDENGNTFQWDALNRLTRITLSSGASSQFSYDGLSRRTQIVEKDASNTITSTKNYLWIGLEVAEERDATDTVTKRFFAQGEQQGGTNYYYTRDHLGCIRELLNSSGTILTRYNYDPYGKTTFSYLNGSNDATFQYAGMMKHTPSGLYLPILRGGYDSTLGKFIQRDLLAENGGINQYEYSDNEPINEFDPLGLDAVIVIHREVPPPGQQQRDAPGMIIIFENGKCTGSTTCNANGYYPGTHGLYPGTYNVIPRTDWQPGDHFPNGTPGVTAPGNTKSGDAGHGYHNVYIHYALQPGQGPDSEGCITVPTAPTNWPKEIQDLVNRNLNSGGTTVIIIFNKPNAPVPQPVK